MKHFKFIPKSTTENSYSFLYKKNHEKGTYAAYIRGKRCKTTRSFFLEFSAAFQFPDYFGENWDAWDECITDLEWLSFKQIYVIIDDFDLMFSEEENASVLRDSFVKWIGQKASYWYKKRKRMEVVAFVEGCQSCQGDKG